MTAPFHLGKVDGVDVVVMTRAECGLPAPDLEKMRKRPVHPWGTTVHHTATPDPEPHPVARWLEIFHEATSGQLADRYVDTPYNDGVAKLEAGVGVILGGRPHDVIGAHARPITTPNSPPGTADVANLYTLGVALVGTRPTPESNAALKAYLFLANVGEGIPLIVPHSHWDPTECPSDEQRGWLWLLNSPNVHF